MKYLNLVSVVTPLLLTGCFSEPVIKPPPVDNNVTVSGGIETPTLQVKDGFEVVTREELHRRLDNSSPEEQVQLRYQVGIGDPVIKTNLNITFGKGGFNTTDVGGVEVYECRQLLGEQVVVTVGILPIPDDIGFVLFDGGTDGLPTQYERNGLEKEWRWSDSFRTPDQVSNGTSLEYSIVIRPGGTGMYYDFSGLKKGESTTPRMIFSCEKTRYE